MNSVNSPGRLHGRSARVELAIVLALEVALVAALHWAAGSRYAVPLGSFGDWIQTADPTVALVALARLAALAIGYWLLVTTVLYALAHYLGWHSMTEVLRWITLPFVRRIVQGVTAMSLTGASLMGPAAITVGPALAQDAVVAQATDEATSTSDEEEPSPDGTDPSAGYRPDAAGWPTAGVDNDFWRPSAVAQTGQTGQTASPTGDYTVVNRDHLWSIAENHLRTTTGRDVTEDEICQYWVRVIDANRDALQSGDPDLIFPQERITLPDVFSE